MKTSFYPQKSCGLPIKDALQRCPSLRRYIIKGKNRIDLGNSHALLLYNRLVLQDFMSLDFTVPSGYLIPTVCSRWLFVNWIIQEKIPFRVLEIGTGASAIIAMMFAKLGCHVEATESDERALESALDNVRLNDLESLVLIKKVMKERILRNNYDSLNKFDAIVCNPPQYNQKYFQQQFSNKGFIGQDFELVGGKEGHEFIVRLLEEVRSFQDTPKVYFQLTFPRLHKQISTYLQNQGYSFLKVQRTVGTRQRFYFKVEKVIKENL
ncbi:MAG: RlmF-related methyltransferase [Candidatus Thorarchaeota archaeon]